MAHMRGTPHSEDVLVYQDDDERFNLGAGRTRDGRFLIMESSSTLRVNPGFFQQTNRTDNSH